MTALVRVLVASAIVATAASTAAADGDEYRDGAHALIDFEAREALAKGDLDRAWELFAWLVRLRPNDPRALRELGRVAAAKGAFRDAERALRRCLELRGDAPDPEAHFIRGEALIALGRRDEALAELATAEAELQYVTSDHLAAVWRARIYILRGDVVEASRVLEAALPGDPSQPGYDEVAVMLAESYMLARQPRRAARLLDNLLRFGPNQRAEEMLAWALAQLGDHERELFLRANIAAAPDASVESLVEHARALARSDRPDEALGALREARARGDLELDDEIDRLDAMVSPEVMAFFEAGEYPTGRVAGGGAATVVSVSRWLALQADVRHYELADRGDAQTSSASLAARLDLSIGRLAAGGVAWRDARDIDRGGATVVYRSPADRWLSLYARADYHAPWVESAISVRESGSSTGLEAHLFARLFTQDLLLVGSARSRRLELAEMGGDQAAAADVHYMSTGLDWVAWANYSATARGASLQTDMLSPADFASSVVVSARHSEVFTRGGLEPRLYLVDRSRIEQLTVRGRKVMDDEGVFSLGAHAAAGYDLERDARLWQVGGEALLSITPMVRLTARAELATETTSGLTGERLTGFVGLNADL